MTDRPDSREALASKNSASDHRTFFTRIVKLQFLTKEIYKVKTIELFGHGLFEAGLV